MKLEGVDPEHQSVYCVLTVAEVSFIFKGLCGVLIMGKDALKTCKAQAAPKSSFEKEDLLASLSLHPPWSGWTHCVGPS